MRHPAISGTVELAFGRPGENHVLDAIMASICLATIVGGIITWIIQAGRK